MAKNKKPDEAFKRKLAARIKALLNKVTSKGATPAEQGSALRKAKELVIKYGLTAADVSSFDMTVEEIAFWEQLEADLIGEPDKLLDVVEGFLRRFVVYPSDHASVTHALWCAHAHLMDCWHTTPRLAFMSAEKASGKSRALEVTALLVPSPMLSINASPQAIVRSISAERITILHDEIDGVFGSAKAQEANLDLRSILNAGYRRGAKVHRCVVRGKVIEVEQLDSFAAVAVAGLRTLPDTLASRSIFIHMRRRADDEKVDEFRLRKIEPEGVRLMRRLETWCRKISQDVGDAEPEMPGGIRDRAAECWEPLIAVADAAGGSWPRRVRAAAVYLAEIAADDTDTAGVELLRHCRDAFMCDDKLWTVSLLQRLRDRPESPWTDIKGKPLDDRGLAERLRPYGIKSKEIRIGAEHRKGYAKADFSDAWKRYCPPSPGPLPGVAQNERDKRDKRDSLDIQDKNVADVAAVAHDFEPYEELSNEINDVADEWPIRDKRDILSSKNNDVAAVADVADVLGEDGDDLPEPGSFEPDEGTDAMIDALGDLAAQAWDDIGDIPPELDRRRKKRRR